MAKKSSMGQCYPIKKGWEPPAKWGNKKRAGTRAAIRREKKANNRLLDKYLFNGW